MKTLLLDRTLWDLCKDASGNIAVADAPYALAQDASSSVRTFAGEVWYDTARGIPYWAEVLGHWPALGLLKTYFVAAAMKVPGVVAAQAFISQIGDRSVSGQIQVTDRSGALSVAAFNSTTQTTTA